jgi:hypothetical protein
MLRHRLKLAASAAVASGGIYACWDKEPTLVRTLSNANKARSLVRTVSGKDPPQQVTETTTALPQVVQRLAKSLSESLAPPHGAPLLEAPGPRAADAALAGLGLFGGLAALGLLEPLLGLKLFAPPMMASGIIFFAGPTPPSPKGFLSGTLCSATLSFGMLALLSPLLPPAAAQGAAAGTLLVWYKATGAIFPPAAVLAGALTTATVSAAAPAASLASVGRYLAFPWLAGHTILFIAAYGMSDVRQRARVALTKRELAALKGQSDATLQAMFVRFDTSGDGAFYKDESRHPHPHSHTSSHTSHPALAIPRCVGCGRVEGRAAQHPWRGPVACGL